MTAEEDDTYEHWPEDFRLTTEAPVASRGYDSYNGLRDFTYYPSYDPPSPPASPPRQAAKLEQPITYSYAQPQVQVNYPPAEYNIQPQPAQIQVTQPAPVYYGYAQPQPQPAKVKQAPNNFTYYPSYSGMQPQTNAWMGRTKAQVDEDNMKIAAKEGAYDSHKKVPSGVKDDQMMWVVETDGSHTLR